MPSRCTVLRLGTDRCACCTRHVQRGEEGEEGGDRAPTTARALARPTRPAEPRTPAHAGRDQTTIASMERGRGQRPGGAKNSFARQRDRVRSGLLGGARGTEAGGGRAGGQAARRCARTGRAGARKARHTANVRSWAWEVAWRNDRSVFRSYFRKEQRTVFQFSEARMGHRY